MSKEDADALNVLVMKYGMAPIILQLREIARGVLDGSIIGLFTKIYDAIAEGRKIA